ncbi:MerR family transcriptional regulator [Halomonas piscis]|uniref:MerR family transcriptional regulator n=1 Tax=Halomonas piscis TaxID=3031727 RepID=UPI00289BF903|nr:helix-turn-helix domain-containing protein [Halomonas piscis]
MQRQDTQTFGIGTLASRAGCQVQTVRYYEEIGLLPQPARNAGNQRRYDEATLRRLTFIRHSRDFGFSVEAVRELLDMADHPNMPCDHADAIAKRHLDEVESRIERLSALRDELKRMVAQCAGGRVEECRIVEVLSDHDQCLHASGHGGRKAIR